MNKELTSRLLAFLDQEIENQQAALLTPQDEGYPQFEALQKLAVELRKETQTYTIFCQSTESYNTTWVDAVEASSPKEAVQLGIAKCAADWELFGEDENGETDEDILEIARVQCVGIAFGDVHILGWDDERCLSQLDSNWITNA